MGYGKTEKPCDSYREWKGQAPLCGNCAWTKDEHKQADSQSNSKEETPNGRSV